MSIEMISGTSDEVRFGGTYKGIRLLDIDFIRKEQAEKEEKDLLEETTPATAPKKGGRL